MRRSEVIVDQLIMSLNTRKRAWEVAATFEGQLVVIGTYRDKRVAQKVMAAVQKFAQLEEACRYEAVKAAIRKQPQLP